MFFKPKKHWPELYHQSVMAVELNYRVAKKNKIAQSHVSSLSKLSASKKHHDVPSKTLIGKCLLVMALNYTQFHPQQKAAQKELSSVTEDKTEPCEMNYSRSS